MSIINFPILYVPDPLKGRPLGGGQIFIGMPGLDPEDGNGNPINTKQLSIVKNDGTVIPVLQPLVLSFGGVPTYNGSTVRLDVDGDYSFKMLDKDGDQKYYIENVLEGAPLLVGDLPALTASTIYPIVETNIINDLSQAYEFPTVALMIASAIIFPVGKRFKTQNYNSTQFGGGSDYIKKTATQATTDGDTVDELGSFTLADGTVAIIDQGNEMSVLQVGMDKNNTTGDDESLWNLTVNSPNYPVKWIVPKGTYRMSVIRLNDVEVEGLRGNLINLFYGGSTPTMGQFNSDVTSIGLNIQCTETDLDNARCALEGAENTVIRGGTIKGFRDVTGSTDAWGFRISDTKNVQLIGIGFDDNTQSDIAVVDNNRGLTIDGCYGTTSQLHVNFEPNTSAEFNRACVLKNMSINILSLLDTNQGDVSTDVDVQSCEIGNLKYYGSKARLSSCTVNDYLNTLSTLWFGELKLDNTLAIGENLLEDPYMLVVGFDKSESITQGYKWHKSDVSAVTNFNTNAKDGAYRYTRLNPDLVSGRITYETTQAPAVVAGEVYLIAITGRWVAGANSYVRVNDGGVPEFVGRIFNQADKDGAYFSTQMFFLKVITTGEIRLEVGITQTQAGSVDISSISLHKVIDGTGGNAQDVLAKTHNQTGFRTIEYATLPALQRTTINGIQLGDRIVVAEDTYVYNGTTTFEQITQV